MSRSRSSDGTGQDRPVLDDANHSAKLVLIGGSPPGRAQDPRLVVVERWERDCRKTLANLDRTGVPWSLENNPDLSSLERLWPSFGAAGPRQPGPCHRQVASLFRQCARSIHPDMARTDKERNRRAALMSALNDARERGCLDVLVDQALRREPGFQLRSSAAREPHVNWFARLSDDDPMSWPGAYSDSEETSQWTWRLANVHAALLCMGRLPFEFAPGAGGQFSRS